MRRLFQRPAQASLDQPRVAPGTRVYAVGDLHGRFDLMMRLLNAIRTDAESRSDDRRTRIVFLGDYIDRGDDSRSVLDSIVRLARSGNPDLVFLRGNHEAALLSFLDDPLAGRTWLDYGAAQTFASYGLPPPPRGADRYSLQECRDRLAAAMATQIPVLRSMAVSHQSGDVLFSHAGVNPSRPFDDEDAMIWGHPEFLGGSPVPGLLVVHGHFDDPDPVMTDGRICVDTGAYYSGRLTAVRLDDHEAFLTVTA